MTVILEQLITYGVILILGGAIVYVYVRKVKSKSKEVEQKVAIAKEEGSFEPVSLHPYIDLNTCIGSAACVVDCPEKDILGIVDDKATVINTSNCVGHGACFHACPVEAISLRIGTETRGVDLPHVNEKFETNMQGVYIAGELGGMGLIKNSVEQGYQAVRSIVGKKKAPKDGVLDLAIIGAGPAGIAATLEAKKQGLTSITLEQESLGGTVYTFPREKIVMTSPMDLPLYGKVKLHDTSKDELISLWKKVIDENNLEIIENTKVEQVIPTSEDTFKIKTSENKEYISNNVLLAIGRRGSPRKLDIPGEESINVHYRLLEPERIAGKKITVVGGGDSAIESALMLMNTNDVTLSYRKDKFTRLKPKNREKIMHALEEGSVKSILNSNLKEITLSKVYIDVHGELQEYDNDLVYIFAGGELPTGFLKSIGIEITKRFGYIMKSYK